jgi:TPR repeat protein/serine/threonine protein kinase
LSKALELPFEFENYWVTKVISEDDYSICYKAEDMKRNSEVVIEELCISSMLHRGEKGTLVAKDPKSSRVFEEAKRAFIKETRIVRNLEDERLATPFKLVELNNTCYKIYPRLKYRNITLESTICDSERELIPIIMPLMKSLEELHHKNIFHSEINIDSIGLLKEKPYFKPFSPARFLFLKSLKTDKNYYDKSYISPELLNSQNINAATDIYAFGVTLFKMITGKEFSLKVCESMPVVSFMPEGKEFSETFLDALQLMYHKDETIRFDGWHNLMYYCTTFKGNTAPIKRASKQTVDDTPSKKPKFDLQKLLDLVSEVHVETSLIKKIFIGAAASALIFILYVYTTIPSSFDVKDLSKVSWTQYKIAASQGNPLAQRALAKMYRLGVSTDVDLEASLALYKDLANKNDKDRLELAHLYVKGQFGSGHRYKGMEHYTALALGGNIEAQMTLAKIYQKGLYQVEKNSNKAYKWYSKAARMGNSEALAFVSSHKQTFGSTKRNAIKAEKVNKAKKLKKAKATKKAKAKKVAKAKKHNTLAMAIKYKKQRKYSKALAIYTLKAKQGNKSAKKELNSFYKNGWKLKRTTLLKLYLKEAKKGSAQAQYALGDLYYKGYGQAPDYNRAKVWMQKSALQKYIKAEEYLGRMYTLGVGIEKDERRAAFWYGRAKLHKKIP